MDQGHRPWIIVITQIQQFKTPSEFDIIFNTRKSQGIPGFNPTPMELP